jgi:transposase
VATFTGIRTLVTKGESYVDQGQAHYEEKYRQRVIKNLTKRAEALGFELTAIPEVA